MLDDEDMLISQVILYRKVNEVLFNTDIKNDRLKEILKDFLTCGCKCRNDYVYMVVSLLDDDPYTRDVLLKN